jgi:hypothetical protein
MTTRNVSREPYRVRRDRREVLVAIGAAALIVILTAVAVWILAPSDGGSPTNSPSVTVPQDSPDDTTATTTATAPAETPTTVPTSG